MSFFIRCNVLFSAKRQVFLRMSSQIFGNLESELAGDGEVAVAVALDTPAKEEFEDEVRLG